MKDVVVRAFKTFIQAAISYVCTISFIDIDWSDNTVVGGVILAALAAGISALMNIDWEAISLEKAAEEADDEAEDDDDAEDSTDTEADADADDTVDSEGTCETESDTADVVTETDSAAEEEEETEVACG